VGMMTIEIEPQRRGADIATEVQRALGVLRKARIEARRRVRSLEMMGLIQVPDAAAERAVSLLVAANIRATIRPS
jgi:capsule polysaccharide export protein KpsE/RkpR